MTGGKVDRTGTVADYSDADLLERVMSSIMANRKRRQLAWDAVSEAFGMGSTYSAQLCRRFGIDPDEVRK